MDLVSRKNIDTETNEKQILIIEHQFKQNFEALSKCFVLTARNYESRFSPKFPLTNWDFS